MSLMHPRAQSTDLLVFWFTAGRPVVVTTTHTYSTGERNSFNTIALSPIAGIPIL